MAEVELDSFPRFGILKAAYLLFLDGMVCSAPAQGGWYRAQVVSAENELQQVTVKFLDYGGYAELPASSLRQIRLDFMSLPFQGAECYLANIIPVECDGNYLDLDFCLNFTNLERSDVRQRVLCPDFKDTFHVLVRFETGD